MTSEKTQSQENPPEKKFDVGGQAVIEGVMMRGPRGYVTAVRLPSSGDIVTQEIPYRPLAKRIKPARWPIFRGAIGMIEMMVIGLKSLSHAGNLVADDEEEAARQEKISNGETVKEKTERGAITKAAIAGSMAIAMLFAIVVFIAIPNLVTHGLSNLGQVREMAGADGWLSALWTLARGSGVDFQEYESPIFYNIFAAAVRITIFLTYIWAISFMSDIRRVFQYHGAEHMAIKTYEAKEPLEVEYARTKTREHPRCGTTFLFITMLIAIFIYSIATKIMLAVWPSLAELGQSNWWALKGILIASHVCLMPLVAGISYEIIKYAGKCPTNPLIRPIIWPGLMFQRLTTKPPDDSMLEVALKSLERALVLCEVPVPEDKAAELDDATGAIY